jgi:hypothetical protein
MRQAGASAICRDLCVESVCRGAESASGRDARTAAEVQLWLLQVILLMTRGMMKMNDESRAASELWWHALSPRRVQSSNGGGEFARRNSSIDRCGMLALPGKHDLRLYMDRRSFMTNRMLAWQGKHATLSRQHLAKRATSKLVLGLLVPD